MRHPMRIEVVTNNGVAALRVTVGTQAIMLDGSGVEKLIEGLALFRASMKPEVCREISRTKRYVIEIDPCWYVEPSPAFDGFVAFFRHSGLGWAGFAMPKESTQKLRDEFMDYVANPIPQSGLPN
ncbi:hypothetical protein [Paraburkholderia sp.]|uniref:hypothetical protein n=1 Tax=Paraburkholderia sp. TaxID=1926495 RepID=UPI00397B7257